MFKFQSLEVPQYVPVPKLVKIGTLNHRLPIQRGRVMNLPYEDRLCTKCSSADIGDEFHYVFSCPFFVVARSRK